MGIPAPLGVAAAGLPNAGDQANAYLSQSFVAIGPGKPFAFRGPMNLAIWGAFNTALTTTAGSLSASLAAAGAVGVGTSVKSSLVPPGTTIATIAGTAVTLALPNLTFPGEGLSISGNLVTLPAGSNVARLLGATVIAPSSAEYVTIPAGTTVTAITQYDVAPTSEPRSPGQPGIIQLSAAPTVVPNVKPMRPPLEFVLAANAITAAGTDAAAIFTGAGIVFTGTLQLEYSFDGGATFLPANLGSAGQVAVWAGGTPIRLVFGEPERNVLYRLNCLAYTGVGGVTINTRISQTGGAAESLAIGPLSGG